MIPRPTSGGDKKKVLIPSTQIVHWNPSKTIQTKGAKATHIHSPPSLPLSFPLPMTQTPQKPTITCVTTTPLPLFPKTESPSR